MVWGKGWQGEFVMDLPWGDVPPRIAALDHPPCLPSRTPPPPPPGQKLPGRPSSSPPLSRSVLPHPPKPPPPPPPSEVT